MYRSALPRKARTLLTPLQHPQLNINEVALKKFGTLHNFLHHLTHLSLEQGNTDYIFFNVKLGGCGGC